MLPVCRKLKAVQGPHSTCLMTAGTYWTVFPFRHSSQFRTFFSNSGCCLPSCLLARHRESTVFLGTYLLVFLALPVFAMCSLLGNLGVRLWLRLQLKLALYLILVQRVPFEFRLANKLCLLCLHLVLFVTGGLGFLALSFIDT